MTMLMKATPNETMSSREIAELTGKEHKHVKRDCEVMFAELEIDWIGYAQKWTHPQNGQTYTEYLLTYELVQTLITGYSIKLRHKVIQRLNYLEGLHQPKPVVELTTLEILRIATEAEQGRLQAVAERDHAIATKAQIGSKREATAMNTAAQAVREKKAIEAKLGRCINHASILAVQNATGASYAWHPLKAYCSKNSLPQVKAHDDRWGKVNTYPAQAWLAVYGVDIVALFGEVAA